ncbi:unnamed protein product, partial [Didymodactylos carnosus]
RRHGVSFLFADLGGLGCYTQPFRPTKKNNNSKEKYFITRTAYLFVEINAHSLLYLIVLVQQQQLPREALNLYLCNSQSCESIFRNIRALSGAYSTIVNFTVYDFLRRAQKLTILNDIKSKELVETEKQLKFPVHHKHKYDNQFLSLQNLSDVESLDVQQTIRNSHELAVKLIEQLNISKVLKKHNVFKLDELSEFIGHYLRTKSKLADNSKWIMIIHPKSILNSI